MPCLLPFTGAGEATGEGKETSARASLFFWGVAAGMHLPPGFPLKLFCFPAGTKK